MTVAFLHAGHQRRVVLGSQSHGPEGHLDAYTHPTHTLVNARVGGWFLGGGWRAGGEAAGRRRASSGIEPAAAAIPGVRFIARHSLAEASSRKSLQRRR